MIWYEITYNGWYAIKPTPLSLSFSLSLSLSHYIYIYIYVLSMGQLEQIMSANKWLMLNCDNYINSSDSFKNVIDEMC